MKRKSLHLSRETIRQLTHPQLARAAGGYVPEPHDPTEHCVPPPQPGSDNCQITTTCHTYAECVTSVIH